MKTEIKYKILYWAVILLALLNISTIATLFINRNNSVTNQEETIIIDPERSPLSGMYLKSELNFDQSQLEIYRNLSREFRHSANQTIGILNSYKSKLSQEISQESPNREKTRLYSDSIGIQHANLKEITTDFYLKLRNNCTPQQALKLQKIFEPLFRDNPSMRGSGTGKKERNRRKN